MKYLRNLTAIATAMAVLVTSACSSGGFVKLLSDAEVATNGAINLVTNLEKSHLVVTSTAGLLLNYLGQVSTALSTSVSEVQSSDTTVVKIENISTVITGIVAPQLPGALPVEVETAIFAVQTTLNLVLNQIKSTKSFAARSVAQGQKPPALHPSLMDRYHMTRIKAAANKDTLLVQNWKAAHPGN